MVDLLGGRVVFPLPSNRIIDSVQRASEQCINDVGFGDASIQASDVGLPRTFDQGLAQLECPVGV
jgi:hypothetical protein